MAETIAALLILALGTEIVELAGTSLHFFGNPTQELTRRGLKML
jgi:hypothetical protein